VVGACSGPDRAVVQMVKRAYELWEKLDPSVYVETGALWMHRGDDSSVRAAVPILQDLCFVVDKLTVADARRRYPQIDFKGVKSVWFERKAGALFASRARGVVRYAFLMACGRYSTAR